MRAFDTGGAGPMLTGAVDRTADELLSHVIERLAAGVSLPVMARTALQQPRDADNIAALRAHNEALSHVLQAYLAGVDAMQRFASNPAKGELLSQALLEFNKARSAVVAGGVAFTPFATELHEQALLGVAESGVATDKTIGNQSTMLLGAWRRLSGHKTGKRGSDDLESFLELRGKFDVSTDECRRIFAELANRIEEHYETVAVVRTALTQREQVRSGSERGAINIDSALIQFHLQKIRVYETAVAVALKAMAAGEKSLLDCAESASRMLKKRCRTEDVMAGAIRGLAACVGQGVQFAARIREMADKELEVLRQDGVDVQVDASTYAQSLLYYGGGTNARTQERLATAYDNKSSTGACARIQACGPDYSKMRLVYTRPVFS